MPSRLLSALIILVAFVVSLAFSRRDTSQLPLLASYDFEDGRADGCQPNHPEHWRVVELEGSRVYELAAPGPQGKIRAPTSWALLAGHEVTSFVFTGRMRSNVDPSNSYRDLCIFFHFQDPTHLYYVHFSARSDEVHNIIGLVNGANRVKINLEPAGQSIFRLTDKEWHTFKVTYDASSARIAAYLDDMDTPILTAVDKTLCHGLVGIGSFDDPGFFDDLTLWGIEKK